MGSVNGRDQLASDAVLQTLLLLTKQDPADYNLITLEGDGLLSAARIGVGLNGTFKSDEDRKLAREKWFTWWKVHGGAMPPSQE